MDAFTAAGKFWRGNLHGHSTNSDGKLTPEEVCTAYRNQGYDFIAITDHFRSNYNFPITDTAPFRQADFTTLIGAEVHAPRTTRGVEWHILAVGLPYDFEPTSDTETGIQLAARCAAAGAFVAVAHPHWYNLELEDALSLEVAHAVEVYNHTCGVRAARGYGDAMWDAMLSAGRKVTGIAVDDSHFKVHDAFGGWVMVKAEENKPELLLQALKQGNFYATQGPLIEDLSFDDGEIVVRCTPATHVFAVGKIANATDVHGTSMTRAHIDVEKFKTSWCRVVVRDAMGRQAWTNPIWFE